jgi:hypothetical protein
MAFLKHSAKMKRGKQKNGELQTVLILGLLLVGNNCSKSGVKKTAL